MAWPTTTWAGGSAPTLQTAPDAVDTIGLLSVDGGVTWFGYYVEDGRASALDDLTDVTITSPANKDTLRHDGSGWVNDDKIYITDGTTWSDWATLGSLADRGTVTHPDFTEVAAPATPASGRVRLCAKTDGSIVSKDDAGTETAHGAGGGGSFDPDVHMPWHIPTFPQVTNEDGSVGTWAITSGAISNDDLFPFMGWSGSHGTERVLQRSNRSAAQNDHIEYRIPLAAGTWEVPPYGKAQSDPGIVTVQFDGVSKGTIDTYAASGAGFESSVAGITVAATALTTVKLLMAAKNASSSAHKLIFGALVLHRTAWDGPIDGALEAPVATAVLVRGSMRPCVGGCLCS